MVLPPGRSRGVPAGGLACIALFGIALGLLIGRLAAGLPRAAAVREHGPSEAASARRPAAGASALEDAAATGNLPRLRDTRAALVQEVSALEAALPRPRTPEERKALAVRLADVVRRIEDRDRPAGLELLKLRRLLEPADAEALRGELERAQEQPIRNALISAVLGCGGADAAALLLDVLEGRFGLPEDRDAVVRFLMGTERTWANLEALPVTSELLETARRLSTSTSYQDRAAATTLLGISAREDSIETLRRMVEADSNVVVRTGAIAGLGLSGDAEALRWLEEDFLPRLSNYYGTEKATLQFEAQDAVKRLKRSLGR
ncbi:MAG: HEAT repeat domain-containing protein [Planctomycetia bacterium]|nr:HEAT repeat domain-containing protein [Planctomycetia bacterium]